MKKTLVFIFILSMIIAFSMVVFNSKESNDEDDIKTMESSEVIQNISENSFKGKQAKNERVKEAIVSKENGLKKLFVSKNLTYPPKEVFLRAFKEEEVLELWAKEEGKENFELLKSYRFTKSSGVLGPKRKQGDNQIPEGFYYIERFNPQSKFYLSLGINYPNKSDKILGDKEKPGNDIFIHGGSASVGCIPIGDENIKEVYLLSIEAKDSGQSNIPVHIYPIRLNDKGVNNLKEKYIDKPELIKFWENLKPGYDYFEENKVLQRYEIDNTGKYIFDK